jgi:hypothetical protein
MTAMDALTAGDRAGRDDRRSPAQRVLARAGGPLFDGYRA